jgi:tetratricopeptide (TPR) repeat protein
MKVNSEEMFDKFLEGETFQDYLGWSDELMTYLYDLASQMIEDGLYEDALDSFTFLSSINPYCSAFYSQTAYVYSLQKKYKEAIDCCSVALSVGLGDPFPYIQASLCYRELKDIDSAKESLELAIKMIQEDPLAKPYTHLIDPLREGIVSLNNFKKRMVS